MHVFPKGQEVKQG